MSRPRRVALSLLLRLFKEKVSLTALLNSLTEEHEKPFIAELCYGTCRYYHQLNAITKQLLQKPFKGKDSDLHLALIVGLYQLNYSRIPAHAAVKETVDLANHLKKPWAKAVLNASLRRFINEKERIEEKHKPQIALSFPSWLFKHIKKAWPDDYLTIMTALNERAPMSLRVNRLKMLKEDYLSVLKKEKINAMALPFSHDGIVLAQAMNVNALPYFAEGYVSVQDEAAQLAALLLDAKRGESVLDACSAPGGKACHILEKTPQLKKLVALDSDKKRLVFLQENAKRLQLTPSIVCGDALRPALWWDGELFDAILLDAPCSATGVIRRHPDIKLLRQETDINKVVSLQQQLLASVWPLLKPNGRLLYATCSILPEENHLQISQFLSCHKEAMHCAIDAPWGIIMPYGRQLLPTSHDGFYYALLKKV